MVVPHRASPLQRLAARLIHSSLLLIGATVRFGVAPTDLERVRNIQAPCIFCVWHNRLALSIILYRKYVLSANPGRRMAGLVSASRDGALLARVFELFGMQPVRGSSSRRGTQALRELVSWGERGLDLSLTPDGPRGPRYKVHEGVIGAAQLTGMPILPVSYYLPWKCQIRSWDRFQIPMPFTRCELRVGETVRVPGEASPEEREALRVKLNRILDTITQD